MYFCDMKKPATILAALLVAASLHAQTNLTTDLIEQTDVAYAAGRKALICSSKPTFGWALEKKQTAWRIELRESAGTVIWDSGRVRGSRSTGLHCGVALEPSTDYVWTVTVWSGCRKTTSAPKSFTTADRLDDSWSVRPLAKTVSTIAPRELESGVWLADFEKDAYSQISITLDMPQAAAVTVHLGEKPMADGRPDRNPGGSIRYCNYTVYAAAGRHTYEIELRHDPRNAKFFGKPNPKNDPPISMPEYIGEVYPFRYVEVDCPGKVLEVSRTVVNYPFDDEAASFRCSDGTLNAVWELCKYSMKATSFCGYYVDGDRERIPYEADALINQVGHYCTDREYAMARRTIDYLIYHPTWPTEKVNLKTDSIISAGVYPAWHPTEKLIAYSTNNTNQAFHTYDLQKVEVQDTYSDLILYDVEKRQVIPLTNDSSQLDCFPWWSPDGKYLYYCSAEYHQTDSSVNRQMDMIRHPEQLHYNLYRRTYDPILRNVREPELVYDAAALGKSATLPRISPDGQWLMFTLATYGVFHIWHTDADLYLMNLKTREVRCMSELNSDQVESYHSWSSNGQWVIFSSRRDDGNFTRPFLAHIDAQGRGSKPFELPTDNPLYHRELLRSYNVPEFITGPVTVTPQEFAHVIQEEARLATQRP